jgi:hypothetical protein
VIAALVAAITGAAMVGPAAGQDSPPDDWARRKCALYATAWQRVLDTRDMGGIGADFIATHRAFIDSGCDAAIRVCPRSPGEIALADLLTVLSMNEGMASTFVPFDCPE